MKVGIQLYSVKRTINASKDPLDTLKKVAEMGYRYWEPAQVPYLKELGFGLGELPAKEVRKLLDAYGVKVIGVHLNPIEPENLAAGMEYYAELGCMRVGWTGSFYENKEALLKRCEAYNLAGKMAKERGMRFYYHNHFHEFQRFDGEYVLDILLKNTDPELVSLELDTFWAARGGVNPVEIMEKHRDRIILLHQKDFAKDAGEPLVVFEKRLDPNSVITSQVYQKIRRPESFTEVGTGTLDIQSYIDAGNKIGVPYILLEQDFTKLDELESIKVSMDNFRKFKGIEWE